MVKKNSCKKLCKWYHCCQWGPQDPSKCSEFEGYDSAEEKAEARKQYHDWLDKNKV